MSSSYNYQETTYTSTANYDNNYSLAGSTGLLSGNDLKGLCPPSVGSTATATAEQVAGDLLKLNAANTGAGLSYGQQSVDYTSSLGLGAGGVSTSYQSGAIAAGTATTYSTGGAASVSSVAIGSQAILSQIEQAILRSTVPIDINETEEITVNGQRGIWANKSEVVNWRGIIPISQYSINEDTNPEVITKRSSQQVEYLQELAIRYLRPPTPPAPGEIIITQETNTVIPPAPPLIIRQQPPRPSTPEPLVIREAPPQPPASVGRKVITISGKRLPPPPRKVIIERLAPLPSKPQSVIVERWLPYSQVKRRVIFQKSNDQDPVVMKPRNVVIQWEAPKVSVKKEVKYLGVIRANPVEYVQRYGSTLKSSRELPEFVLDIKTPEGIVLAADYKYNSVHELEGEVAALKLVDLDREGLSEYRSYLQRLGISYVGAANASTVTSQINLGQSVDYSNNNLGAAGTSSTYYSASTTVGANAGGYVASNSAGFNSVYNSANASAYGGAVSYGSSSISGAVNNNSLIAELFAQVDRDRNGRISINEAEKLLLKLNSRLNRNYGENEVRDLFRRLDTNRDNTIDLNEFRVAFERLL